MQQVTPRASGTGATSSRKWWMAVSPAIMWIRYSGYVTAPACGSQRQRTRSRAPSAMAAITAKPSAMITWAGQAGVCSVALRPRLEIMRACTWCWARRNCTPTTAHRTAFGRKRRIR